LSDFHVTFDASKTIHIT